jgi:hypothetical protein
VWLCVPNFCLDASQTAYISGFQATESQINYEPGDYILIDVLLKGRTTWVALKKQTLSSGFSEGP